MSLPQAGFEGPLDLLLHLIQKHELDILDIPIAFITEKYLEYLRVMQLLNLDVASEYLVMAATLAHIKSKSLLPQVPADQVEDTPLDEEEADPREALIRRLLEYQKYKHAAEQLRERGTAGQDSFPRGAPLAEAVDPGLPPLAEVPMFALVEAFQRVLDNTRIKLTHDVVADRISLTDRIHQIADRLRETPKLRFEQLFDGVTTREGLVITFLAVLEMAKLRMTRLFQEETFGPILVELADGADSPFEPMARPDATEGAETAGANGDGAPALASETQDADANAATPDAEGPPAPPPPLADAPLETAPESHGALEPATTVAEPPTEGVPPGEEPPGEEPPGEEQEPYEEMSLDDLLGPGAAEPEPEPSLDPAQANCANEAAPEPEAVDAAEPERDAPIDASAQPPESADPSAQQENQA